MNEQPRHPVREISLRTADPNGLADTLEKVLGFTKLRSVEDLSTAILTDGYLQIGITGLRQGESDSTVVLDHIGILTDDLDETLTSLVSEGWSEPANSTPATRFLDGPPGWQLEIRERGWGYDDVIRAGTQLYQLTPADEARDAAIQLPDVPAPATPSPRSDDGAQSPTSVRVADVEAIPPGGARVEVAGIPIFVVPIEGSLYAVQDECPHMPRFGRISEGQRAGRLLECPIHRSRFDLVDGHVLEPPATQGLQCFAVDIHDGGVWVNAPIPVQRERSDA